jgi:hypothetical protein
MRHCLPTRPSTSRFPAELDPVLLAAYFDSYTVGFGAAMLVAAALRLAAAALAWFVLPDSHSNAV